MNSLPTSYGDNTTQSINRLPHEILCYICELGDVSRRNIRQHGKSYLGFQDLMAHVCHHWRTAVLNEPLLWTFISVSQRSHYNRAEEYFRRAGPLTPLHIDLGLGSKIYAGLESRDFLNHLEYSWIVINHLIRHGASTNRWKSLIVSARWADILFELIDMINIQWTPILRFVSLKWDYRLKYYSRDYENIVRNCCLVKEPVSSLLPDKYKPKLHHVELEQIPAGFVFERQLPIAFNLTHLKLTTALQAYSISGIREILSFSPLLESLALHNCRSEYDYEGLSAPPVHLPYLCSLSVGAVSDSQWGLRILKMVDAPSVETFEYFGGQYALGHQVVEYITTGLTEHEIWSRILDQGAAEKRPIFPSLRTLNVGEFYCPESDINFLLLAYPEVTSLEIDCGAVKVLSYIPRVLPKLRQLQVRGPCPKRLKTTLREREKAGLCLDHVQVMEGTKDRLRKCVPATIQLTEYPHFSSDESDDEEPDDLFPPPPPNTYLDDLAPLTLYDVHGDLAEIQTPGFYE